MIIREFKEEMMKTFEIIDLRLMHYFLEIKVKQSDDKFFILQNKYTYNLIKKFKVSGYKIVVIFLDNSKVLRK